MEADLPAPRRPDLPRLEATPERDLIFRELHARPYHRFTGPGHILHLAFLTDDTREQTDSAFLEELTRSLDLSQSYVTARHSIWSNAIRGTGTLVVTWERHQAYCTYTFLLTALEIPFSPFDFDFRSLIPESWLARQSPQLLVATQVALGGPSDIGVDPDALESLFEGHPVNGCSIMGGRGRYFSCFRLHSNGMGRVVLFTDEMSPDETGRSVQRILAIEDLYHLTLLPIPVSREIRPALNQLEDRFNQQMSRLFAAQDVREERETLDNLLRLAADVEHVRARVSSLFPASAAYLSMLEQRLSELREGKIEHILMPSRFVMRRIRPAVDTFQHVLEQIANMSERVSRAAGLLRTRIELSMEEQNQKLLESVDRRAHLQLRLQETVEGLSVIVLSYYSLGLIAYLLKGLKSLGAGVNPDLATGMVAPFLVAAVWVLMRRLKERVAR
jgi:uncharacterized membrane-anchored protein